MTPLQEAFKQWQSQFPGTIRGDTRHFCATVEDLKGQIFKIPVNYDGDCPCHGGSAFHHVHSIDKYGRAVIISRPDEQVCPRERAWRKYLRIRDGHLPNKRNWV